MTAVTKDPALAETTRAVNSAQVHLVADNEETERAALTLCGRPARARSSAPSFLTDGCLTCATRALELGIAGAHDDYTVVNLSRYIAHRPRPLRPRLRS